MGSECKTQVEYAACHGGTWALDPDGFLLKVFFLICCFLEG